LLVYELYRYHYVVYNTVTSSHSLQKRRKTTELGKDSRSSPLNSRLVIEHGIDALPLGHAARFCKSGVAR